MASGTAVAIYRLAAAVIRRTLFEQQRRRGRAKISLQEEKFSGREK